jgi:hypothetical protein
LLLVRLHLIRRNTGVNIRVALKKLDQKPHICRNKAVLNVPASVTPDAAFSIKARLKRIPKLKNSPFRVIDQHHGILNVEECVVCLEPHFGSVPDPEASQKNTLPCSFFVFFQSTFYEKQCELSHASCQKSVMFSRT